MRVVGLDPGWEHSALVMWDGARIVEHCELSNQNIIDLFRDTASWIHDSIAVLVIEQIESMGMAVGKTTFETVYWSGRFAEAWHSGRVERLTRRAIKLHMCGHSTAKDANIRQAILDRFGPSTEKAIGSKKAPGPLYGISKHEWSALAVALTWYDLHAGEIRPNLKEEF